MNKNYIFFILIANVRDCVDTWRDISRTQSREELLLGLTLGTIVTGLYQLTTNHTVKLILINYQSISVD